MCDMLDQIKKKGNKGIERLKASKILIIRDNEGTIKWTSVPRKETHIQIVSA